MAQTADLLAALSGHCVAIVADHGSAIASLFAIGLVGSLSHCTGMCGPLVAVQAAGRLALQAPGRNADWQRLAGAALVPYQLGRATTYAGIGTILALPVGFAKWLDFWWLGPLLLATAGVLFLLQALRALGVNRPPQSGGIIRTRGSLSRLASRGTKILMNLCRPLFQRPLGWRGYVLGLLLGFLPCGLLYAAFAAAAAGGDPLSAALGMLAFALGTFPISWAIGYSSTLIANRWRRAFRYLLPILAIINSAVLFLLAFRAVLVS